MHLTLDAVVTPEPEKKQVRPGKMHVRPVKMHRFLLDSAPQHFPQADGAGFLGVPALSSGVVEDDYQVEKVIGYPLLIVPSQSPLSNEKTPDCHAVVAKGPTRATPEVMMTWWYRNHLGGCFG